MSGYWSYREPSRDSQPLQRHPGTFSAATSALGVLPSTFLLTAQRDESVGDGMDCCEVTVLSADAEAGRTQSLDVTELDVTPSPRETSSFVGGEDVRAGGKEAEVASLALPCCREAVDDIARRVERAWWETRLGVNIRPVAFLAEGHDDGPPEPTNTPSAVYPDEGSTERTGEEEDVSACARRLVRSSSVAEKCDQTRRQRQHTQGRPRPTVPRAFTFRTARLAARREVVKERGSEAEESAPLRGKPPRSNSSAGTGEHTDPAAEAHGSPPPAFLTRMEGRAAARRTAHAQLQRRQQERELAKEAALAAATKAAEAAALRSRRAARRSTLVCCTMDHPDNEAEHGGQAREQTSSTTASRLRAYFVELVATLRVDGDGTEAGALTNKVPATPQCQQQRHFPELVRVASHYHVCIQLHGLLNRWRDKAGASQERRQRAAAQQAASMQAVRQLCLAESEVRASVAEQPERIERHSILALFSREMAYQRVSERRQLRERVALRWHFVKWVALVEEVRDGRRASAYREHLLRCAQEVLRGLQSAEDGDDA